MIPVNINPKIKLDHLQPKATKLFPKLGFIEKLTFQWVQQLMWTGKIKIIYSKVKTVCVDKLILLIYMRNLQKYNVQK
jgi:hypothetical protein